jgi:NTP pyrophosphatase (non-canonical NTP hydrolase)
MSITWAEYIKATEQFVVYPKDKESEYVPLKLISELGEIAGKIAKQMRGDGDMTEAIADEIGDCFWYLARLGFILTDEQLLRLGEQQFPEGNQRVEPFYKRIGYAARNAAQLYMSTYDRNRDRSVWGNSSNEDSYMRAYAESVSNSLHGLIHAYGFDFESILQSNIDKLTSRQERGVIKGSGDKR